MGDNFTHTDSTQLFWKYLATKKIAKKNNTVSDNVQETRNGWSDISSINGCGDCVDIEGLFGAFAVVFIGFLAVIVLGSVFGILLIFVELIVLRLFDTNEKQQAIQERPPFGILIVNFLTILYAAYFIAWFLQKLLF